MWILFCRGGYKHRPLRIGGRFQAIPHNSKCRYGERGAAAAKPKAQIILCAAKVSAASGGYSEPKQGQRSQSARGFCPRSTMRVPQPDIIEHFGNADAVPQPPKRCLSRKARIVRCCLRKAYAFVRTLTPPSTKVAIVSSCASASSGAEACSPAMPLKMKTSTAPMFSYWVLSMPSCFTFSRMAL